jgi:hypothetical protein
LSFPVAIGPLDAQPASSIRATESDEIRFILHR